MGSTGGDTGQQRAQSETLGFILAIGIIIVGALLVAGIGALALNETQEEISVSSAETELTQLDAKAGLVALGDADSQAVSFGDSGVGEEFSIEEDNGQMEIEIVNRTDESTETLLETTLGALTWEGDDARLAYQGGGVFRADAGGGQMVSPPEFHFRGATLTLPTVKVTGDGVLNDEAMVERVGESEAIEPEDGNPLQQHLVTVTVQSEFYEGWADYFEERTDGEVDIDHDAEEVTLALVSPLGEVTMDGAVAGQASGGQVVLQGSEHHPCSAGGVDDRRVDGYDSELGTYCEQYPDDTTSGGAIAFGGDMTVGSAVGAIEANFISGGFAELHASSPIFGDLFYTDGCDVDGGGGQYQGEEPCEEYMEDNNADPTVEHIDGVDVDTPIGFLVESVVGDLRESAPNVTLTENPVENDEVDTLGAGDYYTEEISLSGETVEFDTSDGDIQVAVEEQVALDNDAEIQVTGDNSVNIFVNGTNIPEDHDEAIHDQDDREMYVDDGSTIIAADEDGDPTNDATRLSILGDRNFKAFIADSDVTGAIYAPVGTTGHGEVFVDEGGTLYGGLVSGDVLLGEPGAGGDKVGGTVHFDRNLQHSNLLSGSEGIVTLTFLHVTENEIEITS